MIDEAHAEAARIRAASVDEVTAFARRLHDERREIVAHAHLEAARIVAEAQGKAESESEAPPESSEGPALPAVNWRPPESTPGAITNGTRSSTTNGTAPAADEPKRRRRIFGRAR